MSLEVDEELPPLDLKGDLVVVVVGGALGTLLRLAILKVSETSDTWRATTNPHFFLHLDADWWSRIPWTLLAINTFGVFVATWLLAGPLRHRSPDNKWRLLTITGFLGGFTSYSNLFVAGGWIKQLSVVGAAATIFMAVFAGIGAAWLGWRVARQ